MFAIVCFAAVIVALVSVDVEVAIAGRRPAAALERTSDAQALAAPGMALLSLIQGRPRHSIGALLRDTVTNCLAR
jgi:hypothetical protein